jgi:hypothetical protein
MTTPTTEPVVIEEPAEPGPPLGPDDRSGPIYLGTTPAGECVSGSTQWTYEPCGDGIIVDSGTPPVPLPTTTVANPLDYQLPATGGGTIIGGLAALLLLTGIACAHLSKR